MLRIDWMNPRSLALGSGTRGRCGAQSRVSACSAAHRTVQVSVAEKKLVFGLVAERLATALRAIKNPSAASSWRDESFQVYLEKISM